MPPLIRLLPLRPVSLHARPITISVPTRSHSLLSDYPLILSDSGPRRSPFEPTPSSWTWWQTNFVAPNRRKIARWTATGFVNARFAAIPSPSETPTNPDRYLPDRFLLGATAALETLLTRLSQFTGTESSSTSLNLPSIIKPLLLDRLTAAHTQLTSDNLSLSLSIDAFHADPVIRDIFLIFGPPALARHTLLRGNVVRREGANGVVRELPLGLGLLHREVAFEYAFPLEALRAGGKPGELVAPLAVRRQAMREGVVIGIDVAFDVDVRAVLGPLGGGEGRERVVRREPLVLRFETGHIYGVPDAATSWKIADMDCLLTEEKLLDEERQTAIYE
ncbi:hypothetical protein BDK51DRAFT_29646 [Blyttiomyces helicus]|uniref:Uncharacterized protein n=1 Tax=Blyttiomyces helicus TaxID=388810 RepID=A0A4P9WFX9_9FUNG|nr:hypothetical protein BDK51DRAFT_29646 [Blyttiomyces helicus]|eukprot:RKO90693.1 hypothetical protein BDK51DRAFT_29646 [Blyttiomyces helicus]